MSSTKKKERKTEGVLIQFKTYCKEHPYQIGGVIIGNLYLSGILSILCKAVVELPKAMANGTTSSLVTLNPIKVFPEMFTHVRGYIFLILLFILEWYIWRWVLLPRTKQTTAVKDARGIPISDSGLYGTSALATDEEISDVLNIDAVGKSKGAILGRPLDYDLKDINNDTDPKIKAKIPVYTVPTPEEFELKAKQLGWEQDDKTNNMLNQHMAVFGASGTMKSRALARNLILQAARGGESIIATDPKGELYEECAPYLRDIGYDVKSFNLVNQEHSDSWNCLLELIGEDGEIDSLTAKTFADTIVFNASDEGASYWNNNVRSILKAACLYVVESDDYPVEQKNIGTVYDLITGNTLVEFEDKFQRLPEKSVARRAYNLFAQCTDQVKGQILNNAGIMLEVFQDDKVRNVTSSNEIQLSKPAKEKCAYFCITSDQHGTFDFLAVLFYAMMFIKLVNTVDSARGSDEKRIPVNFVLDEFPNIGQIPSFCRKISTVRSRHLNLIVIFQNIVQLQNRYPMGQWEEILGNCDTQIFLGCTDETTAKYISDKTGISTIEVTSQNSTYARDKMVFTQETDYHEVKSNGQRKVYNPDEVLRLKNTNSLIFLRCQKPLLVKKFDFTLHPDSCKLVKQYIRDYQPQWKIEKDKVEEEKRKKAEEIAKRNAEKAQKEIEELGKQQENNGINANFMDGAVKSVGNSKPNITMTQAKPANSKPSLSNNKSDISMKRATPADTTFKHSEPISNNNNKPETSSPPIIDAGAIDSIQYDNDDEDVNEYE